MAISISVSTVLTFPTSSSSRDRVSLHPNRNSSRLVASALPNLHGLSSKNCGLPLKLDELARHQADPSYGIIKAKKGNPPVMPAVMTPGGPLDLSSILLRNRIIFIGQPVNSQVAQRVISQLLTLASIDEDADILVYLNCPGGSTYSVLAIYDCMSWDVEFGPSSKRVSMTTVPTPDFSQRSYKFINLSENLFLI